jgi:arylsulfatase A-like enzyme
MAWEGLLALTLSAHMHLYALIILGTGLGVTVTRWFRAREDAALWFWRRTLPWVGATALAALIGIQGGDWLRERLAMSALPPARSESPNVLVIVLDTLRADHLSGYGYARPTSPNIDRIARQGVLFENAFATSAWTAPSHASLLTGLYPSAHGIGLSPSPALTGAPFPTIAEALRGQGYRTAAFSANVFWFTRARGFDRGFIRFEDYFQSIGDVAVRPIYGRAIEKLVVRRLGFEDIPGRRRAGDMNRSLLRWIERDRDKPFFAFLNYMDTHAPYLPPPPYRGRFSESPNPGGLLNERIGRVDVPLTSAQRQGELDAYDGAIAYLDDHIGALLEALRTRGLMEKTLLVITSDHGESFGEHGVFLHANGLYREELHVPLIFWGPGRIPSGVRVARPVTNAALAASVMDLVGGNPAVFPGLPLRLLWENPDAYPNWRYPMAEIVQIPWAPKNAPAHHGSMRAVMGPRWQYILHEKLGAELYDRENDPGQRMNLAGRPDMRRIVEGLRSQLLAGSFDGGLPTTKP